MYDKLKHQEKILELLKDSVEQKGQFTKEQNFLRSIEFALEEMEEFEKHYNKFKESVSHLQVFQELLQNSMDQHIQHLCKKSRYLIEKNYTKEEKEDMSIDILSQVQKAQQQRIKLLKNIALKYFYQPKQD